MMKRLLLLTVMLVSACTQEIRTQSPLPIVTELAPPPTATEVILIPPTETPIPMPTATPTPVRFPPPQTLPAGAVSMIAIGDSLTQGVGDGTGRGYPGRLLEMVTMERPGSAITNFGQAGWTSDMLIAGDQGMFGQVQRAVAEVNLSLSQGRGVVVLVWIGHNDLWRLYEREGVDAVREDQDAQRFASNLDTILIELRGAGAQVIIALLDDPSNRPAVLRSENFPGITLDELESMSMQVQRYNELITQKAEQYGVLTVDFYNADIFSNPALLSDDGVHPNAAGYDLITGKWYETLSELFD